MISARKDFCLVTSLAAILLVSGCGTYGGTRIKSESVKPEPAVIQEKIHVDDTLLIRTKDGQDFALRVSQITSETISGESTQGDLEEITIPIDQIAGIDIEKEIPIEKKNGFTNEVLIPILSGFALAFVAAFWLISTI